MATAVSINVRDRTVAPLSNVNIAIINQPNPVENYAATANEIWKLIQLPNYDVRDASTNTLITGSNYYTYFPKSSGGGGGGGGSTLISKSIDENGVYKAKDDNADGYSSVNVDVKTGAVPIFYDVTPAAGVNAIIGKLVKIGPKVTWTGQVRFSSNVTSDKHIFTLPEELRPYTKYLFKCGNGGYGWDYTGYILPNGEVHVVFGNNSAIAQCDFQWDVITPEYPVIVDTTKVSSFTGGIAIIDNMAIMQVSLVTNNFSAGWQNGLFTVPDTIPIPEEQVPFCIYRDRNSAQYPDCYLRTNGTIDVWLDRNLGSVIDFLCVWDISGT